MRQITDPQNILSLRYNAVVCAPIHWPVSVSSHLSFVEKVILRVHIEKVLAPSSAQQDVILGSSE